MMEIEYDMMCKQHILLSSVLSLRLGCFANHSHLMAFSILSFFSSSSSCTFVAYKRKKTTSSTELPKTSIAFCSFSCLFHSLSLFFSRQLVVLVIMTLEIAQNTRYKEKMTTFSEFIASRI